MRLQAATNMPFLQGAVRRHEPRRNAQGTRREEDVQGGRQGERVENTSKISQQAGLAADASFFTRNIIPYTRKKENDVQFKMWTLFSYIFDYSKESYF